MRFLFSCLFSPLPWWQKKSSLYQCRMIEISECISYLTLSSRCLCQYRVLERRISCSSSNSSQLEISHLVCENSVAFSLVAITFASHQGSKQGNNMLLPYSSVGDNHYLVLRWGPEYRYISLNSIALLRTQLNLKSGP